jgi:hypothetical protein
MMQTNIHTPAAWLGAFVMAVALGACGGGSETPATPPPPEPPPVVLPQLELLAGSTMLAKNTCEYQNSPFPIEGSFGEVTSLLALDDGRVLVAENVAVDAACTKLVPPRIAVIETDGAVATFARGAFREYEGGSVRWEDAKPLTSFALPLALASASNGAIWVADATVGPFGSPFVPGVGDFDWVHPPYQGGGIWAIDANRNVSVVAGVKTSGTQDGVGMEAGFDDPWQMVTTSQGDAYVLDVLSSGPRGAPRSPVRKIDSLGKVESLPASAIQPVRLAMSQSDRLVVADSQGNILDFFGGEVWGSGAGHVLAMALDSQNNVYFTTREQPSVIYKLAKGQARSVVVGRESATSAGIELGALPGALLPVSALSIDKNDRLVIASGQAILAVQLKL